MIRMKRFYLSLFLWLTPSLLLADSSVNLIQNNKDEVIVKIKTGDFDQERKKVGETVYHLLTVEGWGRTATVGVPQLPMRGMLIGIPSKGAVRAELIQGKTEDVTGLTVYPCPRKVIEEKDGEIYVKEIFSRDKGAYEQDRYIPGKAVEISETGFMRGQRVAKIDIYPFQYNPVRKKLRVYREMVIRVSFEGGEVEPLPFSKEEIPYEKMLQKLLVNYENLGRYEGEGVQRAETVSPQEKADGILDLKIHLSGEGIYKIAYSDLSSLWSLGSIDPRKIHLKHLGEEIPIAFEGENDGQFDSADYFFFYAPPFSSEFTTDDIYWLSVESINGSRMGSVDGSLGTGTLLPSFTNLYHGEENDVYWQSIPNGEGKDHWFWNRLIVPNPPAPVSYAINFILNTILSQC